MTDDTECGSVIGITVEDPPHAGPFPDSVCELEGEHEVHATGTQTHRYEIVWTEDRWTVLPPGEAYADAEDFLEAQGNSRTTGCGCDSCLRRAGVAP